MIALGSVDSVSAGHVLHESGGAISDVWFPIDCVASLTMSLRDGAGAEVAVVGPEGLVGVTALLGATETMWSDAAVQIGGGALRVPAAPLRQEVARSARLRLLLQRHAQVLLVQTAQAAACSRFHSLEQRLARWLLGLHDRVTSDEIAITHERLATLLGVLRPTVTLAAQRLQDRNVIHYTRGKIRVVDRAGLSRMACECYESVSSEYDRLLGPRAVEQLDEAGGAAEELLREMNSRLMIVALREQQAREEAEEANDATARFFATLSHELRTPLTAILGWSDLLQSRDLDDDTLTLAIETIHRNAEAQRHLVNEMLDLARMRSSKLHLHLEPVDVTSAVRAAVDSCRPAADAKTIAISAIAGDAVTASADPARLQQILTNLLSNAVKFTPAAGSIEVIVVTLDGHVQISVRDSGPGIDSELLPHVFDPFRQGSDAATGEIGMGLGLAIVRQLVALHGGSVDVQSGGAGKGSTFTVKLPLSA